MKAAPCFGFAARPVEQGHVRPTGHRVRNRLRQCARGIRHGDCRPGIVVPIHALTERGAVYLGAGANEGRRLQQYERLDHLGRGQRQMKDDAAAQGVPDDVYGVRSIPGHRRRLRASATWSLTVQGPGTGLLPA